MQLLGNGCLGNWKCFGVSAVDVLAAGFCCKKRKDWVYCSIFFYFKSSEMLTIWH